ncbi:unnamed protein product [Symbiodinium necroappetens]|uniref:Uncharacterized protein n=1 Tax=Symbiodinium necroappetens TaxID=1628268 RepID=A0A813BSJ8_9DINO|nr:unnamed protein product [Symbiodinium necroappetens]
MVVRTIRKSKENLPYKRQSVVNFCVAQYRKCNLAGVIVAEKRDDNQKKIAYTVELYGIEGRKVIAVADVKHSKGAGYEKAVEALRTKAEKLKIKKPSSNTVENWRLFESARANGVAAKFYGGFQKR